MPVQTESVPERTLEQLQRKIEEYERWFRFLDGQNRVLERERQKLSAVLNHSDAGFFVLDSCLQVVWVNEVFTRRFAAGRHPREIVGGRCFRLLCGESAPCETCPGSRALRTAEVAHADMRLDLHGGPRDIYATAMPIRSPFGDTEEAIVMLQDLSDLAVLRRSQEALKTSEERFRSIFENTAAGMATVGREGQFIEVNAAFCRFLGYTEEELRGKTVFDVTHPEDIALSRHRLGSVLSGARRAVDLEKRFIRKDGSTVWGHVAGTWLPGQEGIPLHCVSVVQDITERKRAEEALRESEGRLRLFVEQAPAVIWSTDRQLRFTSCVGAGLANLGLPPDELVGRSLFEWFGTADPSFQPIAAHLRAMAGESVSYETEWKGRVFQVRIEPLLAAGREIIGSVGAALDISALHRRE